MEPNCKQTLEITIPAAEVEKETERVVQSLSARAKLPGFRPGKVPPAMVRTRFAADIREEVVRNLAPRYFEKKVEEQNLRVVGSPSITDLHFHAGEDMRFKAEFEVVPHIELQEYRGLTAPYRESEVTEAEVDARLEQLREQKAEFVSVAPRPAAAGDYAVVSLEAAGDSAALLPRQDELVVLIGGPDTLEAFSENLRGMNPGEEKEFEVAYPDDYGDDKLAGKTVRFHVELKGIRRKELPELTDAFAEDVGEFKTLEELRSQLRRSLQREREYAAQQEAKDKLIDQLIAAHEFPVPEALVDRQIQLQVEQYLRLMAARGADLSNVRLDWDKVRASQRERAVREVKTSLILDRIAEREAIEVTAEELDHEVQRIARQQQEPVAAVRRKLEQEGGLRRIASRIRAEKTLSMLFEQARKVAEE